jgi:two-component system response regulator (stage 0 sporulation protein F)
MKILIVEDVEMARRNMKRILEKNGIEVIEAANGQTALELFESENPDAVSLDIDVPAPCGLELLKLMRQKNENIKVIMVTGIADQKNIIQSFKDGANYFMIKPLDLEKYVKIIKSFSS